MKHEWHAGNAPKDGRIIEVRCEQHPGVRRVVWIGDVANGHWREVDEVQPVIPIRPVYWRDSQAKD